MIKPKPIESNHSWLLNHKGHRQSCEPIKTQSNYFWLMQSVGECVWASHNWFRFYIWLDEKVVRFWSRSGGVDDAKLLTFWDSNKHRSKFLYNYKRSEIESHVNSAHVIQARKIKILSFNMTLKYEIEITKLILKLILKRSRHAYTLGTYFC